MSLRYEVWVNARLFGTATNLITRDALFMCALLLGVPSMTVTRA